MSYTYLLESGEESSAANYSDIPQFAQSRSSHTAAESCCNVNETASCHTSRSGTMYAPSTARPGEDVLTSSAEDSRAKTSASLGRVQASMVNAPDSGLKCGESFAKYDHEASLWRTRQLSLIEGLDVYSETWPDWGMMLNGECWALDTLDLPISGPGFGFMPTPCATDWKGGRSQAQRKDGTSTLSEFRHWIRVIHGCRYPIPEHSETVMGFPEMWSASEPLEMPRYRQWLQQHSASSARGGTHD